MCPVNKLKHRLINAVKNAVHVLCARVIIVNKTKTITKTFEILQIKQTLPEEIKMKTLKLKRLIKKLEK